MRRVQTTELRPLGAGEILDRAVTLYVRRFAAIASVIAVAVVPLMVAGALLDPQSADVLTDMARMLSSMGDPEATRHVAQEMSGRQGPSGAGVVLYLVLSPLLRLAMWGALVRVASRAYAGATTPIRDAYAFSVRRYAPLVIVSLAFVVVGLVLAVPLIVAYVVVVVAVAGLAALHAVPAAVAVAIVGGLLVVVAAVAAGSTIFMTYELASVAVVTEMANPADAIAVAFRRAFARGMKRRTLVGGLVVFLVSEAGAIPVLMLAMLLTALTRLEPLYYATLGAGSLLLDGIVASFVVVFAVDVRVRREGYDLEAALTA